MSFYDETRKDIFAYNDNGQLEMEKLISIDKGNKIEIKPNDGIYINGVKLTGGNGGGTLTPVAVEMDSPSFPTNATITGTPFRKTMISFSAPLDQTATISWMENTTLTIVFDENPDFLWASMNNIIPLVTTVGYRPGEKFDMETDVNYYFDSRSGGLIMEIQFVNNIAVNNLLSKWKMYLDFVFT